MSQQEPPPYRVLARKYRPRNFDELIGQDALVRTLKNAIASGRLAHAYMLTGVRGVGKTTTARIIARALNYTGADGTAGPTTGPTDDCAICQSIAEGRCPDVLEMDAASRTGVEDIREITDGVRYAPAMARYKIYIIDEVHMLSKAAFNALLKTLEEPPPRVIFIFATTEIRKVPVTVLSRCQRFDLRRVDAPTLIAHYRSICGKEQVGIEDEALSLIARAADGSVRDGLSLLDQAISLSAGTVTAQQVQDMLGLADRTLVLDLLEQSLSGDCTRALETMTSLYRNGADPAVVLQDMLDFIHIITRQRAVPDFKDHYGALATETQARAAAMAAQLSMPTLGRAWQIVLKGLGEVTDAPDAQAAAEMIVIRLAYAADLPDPAELLKKIRKDGNAGHNAPPPRTTTEHRPHDTVMTGSGGIVAVASPAPAPVQNLNTMADIEAALRTGGYAALAGEIYHLVRPVRIEQGLLEINLEPAARPGLAADIGKAISIVTGTRWIVTVARSPGAPTMAQHAAAAQDQKIAQAQKNPVVAEVLRLFPGTTVTVTQES